MNKSKISNVFGLMFIMLYSQLTWSSRAVAHVPTFYCDSSNGSPKTMARTKAGVLQMLDWESPMLTEPNTTPIDKCKKYSTQLETYFRQDKLKFLTAGRVNRINIICIAEGRGYACKIPLFRVNGNYPSPLHKLLNLDFVCPYHYDGSCRYRVYIDVEGYLNQSPTEDKE